MGRLRVAAVPIGAHMKPLPTPISAIGSTSCHIGVSGRMTAASHSRLTAKHDNPNAAIPRGWTRSVSRPTYGARHVEITADGASSSAAPVGLSPRTPWA